MATVATRRATSRAVKTSVKTAKVTLPNADDLADALANKLKMSAVKNSALKPEDRVAAMRAVNLASQALSTIVQSGWKRSSEPNSVWKGALENATKLSSDAAKHIGTLRRLCAHDVDVERAAASILGKLLVLELFDLAMKFLEPMHAQLCAILGVVPEVASSSHHLHLLSIPLPSPPPLDSIILNLVSTYFAHALTVLGHSSLSPSIERFSATFASSSPTLLTWFPLFVSLPEKHVDSILTRAYTAINRLCSSSSAPNRMKGDTPSTDNSHSRAVFCLRMRALSCLIQTSPGTIDPNSFWDQAMRSGASYVKTASNIQEGEEQAVQVILKAYNDLVARAERRSDRDSFLRVTSNLESEGRNFHNFCEYWMAFAKRAGDICVLQQIGTLMQVAISQPTFVTCLDGRQESSPTTATGSKRELNGKELIEGTRICTLFAQVTNLFEGCIGQSMNLEEGELVKLMKESIAILKTSAILDVFLAGEGSKEVKRISGKVDRAFEKLRRAGIKLLEIGSSPTFSIETKTKEYLRKLLEACIDALARNLQPPTTNSLTRTIDTLFILARTNLVVADPRTYVPAYEYLSHASKILDPVVICATDSDPENVVDVPNYMRCVSGAFHNLAGALYQSSRYGAAVPFLLEGCTLGGRALLCRVYQDQGKDAEGWKQLEEQLCRRWELLGVCYSKNGDRKNAYISFVQYIRAFPFHITDFATLTDNMSVSELFSASTNAAIKQLASIIERVTYLGTCELLLDSKDVSMRSLLSSHSNFFDSNTSTAKTIKDARVLAALVEAQLDCLESHTWKDGVNTLSRKLLNDAMDLYQADGEQAMPIRRARILVRLMEASYRDGTDLDSQVVVDLAREVEELLSREASGCDHSLIGYQAQYRASAHLWLGLHGHRRADEHQSTLMKQHTDAAVKILKDFLFPASKITQKNSLAMGATRKKASPKVRGKSVIISVSPKPRIQRVPAAPKKAPAKSTRRDPVTPKIMRRTALQVVSTKVTARPSFDGQMSCLVFDNFEKFINLLQLNAQILGLLGLTMSKVHLLDTTKKLCERHTGTLNEDYMAASIELAYEYVKLGRRKRAGIIFSQCLDYVKSDQLPDEICALFYLRFAEALALVEDIPRSSGNYCEALAVADRLDFEDKNASTLLRIHARVKRLERAALGSHAFAMIQYAQDNVLGFIESMLQALRLWNRAVDTLSRLSTPPDSTHSESDPFNVSSLKDTLPNTTTSKQEEPIPHQPYRRPTMNNLEWRVSEGLLTTLFDLCQAYLDRGSVREAEYFAQQAQDLAEALNAPSMTSCALAKKGEIQLYQGLITESHTTLTRATTLLRSIPGVVLADVQRLHAVYNERNANYETAQTLYGGTMVMLEDFGESLKAFDGIAFGPRKSIGSSPRALATSDIVAPELLAAILHRLIWLLRDEDPEALNVLRDKFSSFSHSIYSKTQEHSLNAKLTLHNVYERFHADMFLSSLVESTISLPMGMSSNHDLALAPSTQDILSALDSAEQLYQENLASTASRGSVVSVRESALSLALIRAFQTSLGKLGNGGPAVSAFLLDLSSAVTLRREMLEVINHKYPVFYDDFHWRAINKDGKPLSQLTSPKKQIRSTSLDSEDEGDDENVVDNISSLKDYWHSVKARYQAQSFNDALSTSQLDIVPASWTIIHINVTEDKNTLFISRQEGGVADKEPLIFRVPLKGRRDNGSGDDDDEHLTFEDALSELKDIVRLSDEGTKAAINIKSDDVEGRTSWWKQRGDLNTRMKELLDNIEFCWLGAFKTILSPRPDLTTTEIFSLRDQFDKVFQRSLYLKDQKKKPKRLGAGQHKKTPSLLAEVNATLDDALIKCFSSLSPKCRDEELEDLVYFILDLYQFHGVPVAIAEVDVTQVVVDLRAILEDHASKIKVREQRGTLASAVNSEPEHLFLVLDKNVQGIPWESIPILRGRSVSRIPSVDFLKDRIVLTRWQKRQNGSDGPDNSSATGDDARGIVVDPRKGFFILNPSGDLSRTEERFRQWAVGMQSEGWGGVIGQTLSEQQFLNALRTQDLVVYFGHGGGEQYVRSHKIRSLPRCAATMLWGCSSGALREMGDFDRVGTPYNYMLAGCPTLVANLWDVTDRDIDKFSQAVFEKLRLSPFELGKRVDGINSTEKTSVVAAVAQSRDACKLKYLTGAAPVVYGIPFYL